MLSPAAVTFLEALSRFLGWVYTISWSLSFYPQPWMNYNRKSTAGLTPAFPFLNVVGFTCLSIQTTAFYYSDLIREQYRARNGGIDNTNRFNDVAFALHAVLLCCITASQFSARLWGFSNRKWKVGNAVWGIIAGCMAGLAVALILVVAQGKNGGKDPNTWAWIDVIYALGSVKLIVTFLKYIPQAWDNHKRKSTAGWSIHQILLDLNGGVLSIAQLIIDSSLQSDWSGIKGNPVKFGLGNISIFFDIIFMVQHYILYDRSAIPHDNRVERVSSNGESERPLLRDDEEYGNLR